MAEIKIDYDAAYKNANTLLQAVNISEKACRNVQYVINAIDEHWKGEAAKQFEYGLLNWKREQEKLQEEIRRLSQNIKNVADTFKETEDSVKDKINNGHNGAAYAGGGQGSFGYGGGGGSR